MFRILLKVLSLALLAPLAGGFCVGLAHHQLLERSSYLVSERTNVKSHRFRIRTITAGVNLDSTSDLKTIDSAIEFLQRARKRFEDEGYEIQTVRIATQPLPQYLNGKSRTEALADLRKIDERLSAGNVILSIGPVITGDRYDPEFASWAAQL